MIASNVRLATVPDVGVRGVKVLSAATVVIVGCGGLGHPVAEYLCAAGVGTLVLVDDDVVDTTNLGRQFAFREGDVGKLKAEVLARSIGRGRAGSEIIAVPHRLAPDSGKSLLSRYKSDDLVIVDCTDSFESRHIVSTVARDLNCWHVWGNVFRWEGSVGVFCPARGCAYEDAFADPPLELQSTCASGGVVGAACGLVGSLLCAQVMALLIDGASQLYGKIVEVDSRTLRTASRSAIGDAVLHKVDVGDTSASVRAVSQNEALDCLKRGFTLVDVREEWEVDELPLPGACNVPMARLWVWLQETAHSTKPAFICASGRRALQAGQIAARYGMSGDDYMVIEGGASDWAARFK